MLFGFRYSIPAAVDGYRRQAQAAVQKPGQGIGLFHQEVALAKVLLPCFFAQAGWQECQLQLARFGYRSQGQAAALPASAVFRAAPGPGDLDPADAVVDTLPARYTKLHFYQ